MFMDWWKDLIQKLNKFSHRQPSAVVSEEISAETSSEMEKVKTLQRRVRMQAVTAVASIAALLVLVFAMTAAWYTNVAKTSDLMFETEAWGFAEEGITLSSNAIEVAPGESGIVPVEVDNSANTDGVKISVTIEKTAYLPEGENAHADELRKRIFFYADTAYTYQFEDEAVVVTEGEQVSVEPQQETVSRVYFGSGDTESYTYEILPGQKLMLSEDYYNDVPIKWMWVYDMLGYYFRGTVGDDTVIVDEYIRPIEYDYAYAVFDETTIVNADGTVSYGENYGQLVSTGDLSRAELLQDISSADGYEGTIPMGLDGQAIANKVKGADGIERLYYPVEVDENGVGVWAYLCNKNEVDAGIDFDNRLGSLEESASLVARIVFTAVNLSATEQEVDSAAALEEALNAENVDTVKLRNSIYLNEPVALTGEGDKVIDLNGYGLDYDGTEDMFVVENGASLTVMNGALNAPADQSVTAFSTSGAELVLSGVTATGFNRIIDNNEALNGEGVVPSTIRITNCDFATPDVSLMIRGSGLEADTTTKVIIEGSRIVSDYLAVSGNGNAPNAGTEIVIVNSNLQGTYGALYQPQQRSSTIIKESNLSGYTGIVIKGGTATVIDSIIMGTGKYTPAGNASSGFVDTGDGVYVEAVYDWSASVYIKGDTTISSRYGYAVELYGEENKGPGKIVVQGGTLKMLEEGQGSLNWNGIGTLELYGESKTGPMEWKYDLSAESETE